MPVKKQKNRSRKPRRKQRGGSQENNNFALALRLSLENQGTQKKNNTKKNTAAKSEPLATMPQICFGTAQFSTLISSGIGAASIMKKAISLGYRHFDGADVYGDDDYRKEFAKGIEGVDRNSLWITWKSDLISVKEIQKVVDVLNCKYIDLFLRHHSCLTEKDYAELQQAKEQNLVRFIGVSNCEDIKQIQKNKTKYGIYANQIQARPPGGTILGHRGKKLALDPKFVESCNALGVHVMLFGTVSALQDSSWFFANKYSNKPSTSSNVNKYYIQKYLRPSNVLMVSTLNPESQTLADNIKDVNTFLSGKKLLSEDEMQEMETLLSSEPLQNMST